jgi:hypothetical protein
VEAGVGGGKEKVVEEEAPQNLFCDAANGGGGHGEGSAAGREGVSEAFWRGREREIESWGVREGKR